MTDNNDQTALLGDRAVDAVRQRAMDGLATFKDFADGLPPNGRTERTIYNYVSKGMPCIWLGRMPSIIVDPAIEWLRTREEEMPEPRGRGRPRKDRQRHHRAPAPRRRYEQTAQPNPARGRTRWASGRQLSAGKARHLASLTRFGKSTAPRPIPKDASQMPDTPTAITRAEREDIPRIARGRERLAKAAAKQRSAELQADVDAKLAAQCSFDQRVTWRSAYAAAAEADEKIANECQRLGMEIRATREAADLAVLRSEIDNQVAIPPASAYVIPSTRWRQQLATGNDFAGGVQRLNDEVDVRLSARGNLRDSTRRAREVGSALAVEATTVTLDAAR